MAETLSLTGKFLGAGQIRRVGQNNKEVRVFWIDITDNIEYPNTPELQLRGDKVYLVDNLQRGQTIQVKLQLNGRKYRNPTTQKEGIINNLDVWKIDILQMQSAAAAPVQQQQARPVQQPAARPSMASQPHPYVNEEDNDLPF